LAPGRACSFSLDEQFASAFGKLFTSRVLMSRDDGKRGVGHERATLSMSFQVVARFLATTAHNHECGPVIKPIVIRKTKNSLRTLKIATECEIFYPVGNI